MKTLIAAATAATLGATAALASGPIAEPIYEPPALLPMPSAYNWTGGYAGVGLTYGRAAMSEGGALPDFPATSGAGIGLLAGYNWQNGNLVYGGEVALDFARRDGANAAIALDDGPPINFCKPAVDPLFTSAAQVWQAATLGVVLTGMGADGKHGGRDIIAAGGSIIAQDEATSVVWGMPGAVAQDGQCAAILPLDKIASRLNRLFAGDRS